jgi:hypothetical protein
MTIRCRILLGRNLTGIMLSSAPNVTVTLFAYVIFINHSQVKQKVKLSP